MDSNLAPESTFRTPSATAVRWLIGISVAAYIVQLTLVSEADMRSWFGFASGDLDSSWTIATYVFVHASFWQLAVTDASLPYFSRPTLVLAKLYELLTHRDIYRHMYVTMVEIAIISVTRRPWAPCGSTVTSAWAGRIAGRYGDIPVHYIGREQFVANKRATGRTKDVADLEVLGEV